MSTPPVPMAPPAPRMPPVRLYQFKNGMTVENYINQEKRKANDLRLQATLFTERANQIDENVSQLESLLVPADPPS